MLNARAPVDRRAEAIRMETVLDFLGNPIFGVFILLLLVLILARKLIFVIAARSFDSAKQSESPVLRLGVLFGLVVAILAVSAGIYVASPSVRSEFSFLRGGLAKDNDAIANRSALCFKRIACYDAYAARLRCADSEDFDQCMQTKLDGQVSEQGDDCGDFKALYDEARVSHGECLLRNTASVLIFAVSGFDRAPAKQ